MDPTEASIQQRRTQTSDGREPLKKLMDSPTTGLRVREINSFQSPKDKADERALRLSMQIDDNKVHALIDSGATGNFIEKQYAKDLQLRVRPKDKPEVVSAVTGHPQWITHEAIVNLEAKTHTEEVRLEIVEIAKDKIILGMPWLRKHNPEIDWLRGTLKFSRCTCGKGGVPKASMDIPKVKLYPVSFRTIQRIGAQDPTSVRRVWIRSLQHQTEDEELSKPPPVYEEYKRLFGDPQDIDLQPHQPWDHEIKLKEGKEPTSQPIYPMSAERLQKVKEYIEDNLRKGHIRQSTSPAGYPILFAEKKDGTLRLCVDYRRLNDITVKNRYTLPLISELQDRFQGAKWFTKLDVKDAYTFVRIKEGDEWKTAFKTRYGLYEYLVMPYGLTNAPATFQALINDTLREYLDNFVVAYMDDIMIYSKGTLGEHIKQVKKVMEKLLKKGMRLKLKKCAFHKKEVEFLGFIVTTEGVRMDPGKVQTILEWPRPTKVKEVQAFMGFVNFYRKFIKGFSGITKPITTLTKKDEKFDWTDEREQAFQEIKQKFAEEPVLANHDPELPTVMETDASDKALGATLSQRTPDGKLRLVAAHSRSFTGAELNYEIHDKELLAIVDSFKQWRVYLEGAAHQITVYTDHKNLTSWTTRGQLNRRQVRWSQELSKYDFKIVYRKGSENQRADALSRRADYMQGEEEVAHTILRQTDDGSLEYNRQIATLVKVMPGNWIERIKSAYDKDAMAETLSKGCGENPRISKDDRGILLWDGLVYVPTKLRSELIKEIHEEPASGHQGTDRTVERISRNWYFPTMRSMVIKAIQGCDECAKAKASRHAPYGLLQSIEPPKAAWEEIAFDHITKLPPSKEPMTETVYDSIWVVTDRLTKYAYFIPYKESSTSEDLAYAYI